VGSFLVVDCPLLHQKVVIRLKSVFNDGGKGDGLLNPFAVFLNFGNQFHHLIRDADTKLLWCVRVFFDHLLQGGLGGFWRGIPPEPVLRRIIRNLLNGFQGEDAGGVWASPPVGQISGDLCQHLDVPQGRHCGELHIQHLPEEGAQFGGGDAAE